MPEPKISLKQKIADFVEDVATLDVITLTGNISLTVPPPPPPPAQPVPVPAAVNPPVVQGHPSNKPKWDDLFASITSQLRPAGNNSLQVVAYTHVEFDHDTVQFVGEQLTDEQKALVASHQTAVAAAQKARLDALKTVGELVTSLF